MLHNKFRKDCPKGQSFLIAKNSKQNLKHYTRVSVLITGFWQPQPSLLHEANPITIIAQTIKNINFLINIQIICTKVQ